MTRMNENYAATLAEKCRKNDEIPNELFDRHKVFRGLRDLNGNGVLTELTTVSEVTAARYEDGVRIPQDGVLTYRGRRVEEIVDEAAGGFGFERAAYLLLTGETPTEAELKRFSEALAEARGLPRNFTRDVIMKAPTADVMNNMTRSVLTLASYDRSSAETSLEDSVTRCVRLIATFPLLATYAWHAYNHYGRGGTMLIRPQKKDASTAENVLRTLRPDGKFSKTEAEILDVALILHAEHGGGNNSTFTTRVVTSAGSDAYSTMAAALCSLKGPRHGGANMKVVEMMRDASKRIRDFSDDEEVAAYLTKVLDGDAFDGKGLIYGMGHAIYSLSDPRELVLREKARKLAVEKGHVAKFEAYEAVRRQAVKVIREKRRMYKGVCPNVDFYSGFVYETLGIPNELFTPMFAIARIAGWSAHRIEELVGNGKIIRPAYRNVLDEIEPRRD